MIELILGGARSGKSRLAETTAKSLESDEKTVCYIATATVMDTEMADRISYHKFTRPTHWHTIEESIYLANAIKNISQTHSIILVDCLTLWLSNLLLTDDKNLFNQEVQNLLNILEKFPTNCHLILVSNEIGLGVVPMGELTRRFVDESGFLHQKIAQLADKVTFCVAGLPMVLKS